MKNCELVISFLDLLEERRPLYPGEFHLRNLVRSFLSRLTSQYATYWKQRGKVRHCVLGDENSVYHHLCATVRLQQNSIKQLSFNGNLITSHLDKEQVLLGFYKELLGVAV